MIYWIILKCPPVLSHVQLFVTPWTVAWASLVAQLVKNLLQCKRPWFISWVRKFPQRRDRLPPPIFLGFPGGSDSKESACHAGDLGKISGLGRSPGGGHGNPLQNSCLENLHGQRSLAGYSPHGCKESDMTKQLNTAQDCSMPDSSVHGISRTRILQWVAISYCRRYSQPRNGTLSLEPPALTGRFFTTITTLGSPILK